MAAPLPVALALLAVAGSLAGAQCRPPKDSSEARLLAFFAAPIAFSPAGHADHPGAGAVRLSFDATYVPTPSASIRRASYCNRKSENTELTPVFPRPRLAVGLPGGAYLEASYLPPVTVMDATPNLASLALGWTVPLGRGERWLAFRGHATIGRVEGPITCAEDALQSTNPNLPCYGDTPSSDRYEPAMYGGEMMLGWSPNARVSGYLGGGYTILRPRFRVNFTSLNGGVDNSRVLVDLERITAFAGGRFHLSPAVALTGEVYAVPEDVTTVRVGASWLLRRGAR